MKLFLISVGSLALTTVTATASPAVAASTTVPAAAASTAVPAAAVSTTIPAAAASTTIPAEAVSTAVPPAVVASTATLDAPAAPAAIAAPSAPSAPSPADLASARAAASASLGTLGRFFASHEGTVRSVSAAEAARMAPRLTGPTVAVYDLNPAFVRGRSGNVATLALLATPAAAADGRTASVWTAYTPAGWQVVNIASGTDEETYASTSGLVFQEPQINAWYAVRGGKVFPLNPEARQSLPGGPVALASYQRLVQQRYGDKLPGSPYDHKGLAGGYGVLGSAAAQPPSHHSTTPLLLLASSATLTAAIATLRLLHRRHAQSPTT